ncbi:MAG TPA: acetamidase/formamidase family protein, partial [bacterium]
MNSKRIFVSGLTVLLVIAFGLIIASRYEDVSGSTTPEPKYFLTADQTHNKFSSTIPPVLTVPSGSVIEVRTEEATDGQLNVSSTSADVPNVKFDPIHPLTGPVFVDGAEPGDVVAVKLHRIEIGDWGWAGIFPGFGFLASEFTEPFLKTFKLGKDVPVAHFNDKIKIPLKPFAGVMGVAPATDSLLSTIPPRDNGGNMD